MKKLNRFVNSPLANYAVRTSFAIALVATSAVTLWFATAPEARATTCQVCHKNAVTLTLTCGSLQWRRHIDHGDPMHACGATTSDNFLRPERPAPNEPIKN